MKLEEKGKMRDIKVKVLPVLTVIVLIASLVLSCLPVYATGAGTTATVLNAAPTVSSVDLTPDDMPATPGVQVINPEPATNKTVTITATVRDLNGYDDIVNTSVIATITGPSVIEESPVNLSFNSVVNATTVLYKGSFNMSNHSEGDYNVEVTATDFSGSTGAGSKNFTYSYSKEVTVTVSVAPESAFDSKGNNVTTKVLSSDNEYAVLTVRKGAEAYVELNFIADIPDSATIESVTFYYEHHESSKLDYICIEVYDEDIAAWVRYSGTTSGTDTRDSQDVTMQINTSAEAGNNRIRYVCYESGGKAETGYLDHAYLNITYSYVPDTTPPAKVTGVTVTPVSCSQLDVSWTANNESDLDHYNVYRRNETSGFTLVASPTTNSYSDTGLTANTTYNYNITAVDNSSNEGEASDEKSGMTFTDTVGPVTSDVVANPNPTNGAETVTLTATISDSSTCNSIIADAEYFVNVIDDDGNGTGMNASDGDGKFDAVTEAVTADINVSGWPVGNYTLFVHGRDEAGNWGDTSAVALKVTEMPTNVMHVHCINMSLSKRKAGINIFTHATAVVTIVNATGITVEGATVEGHWSNATTDSDYDGITNSTGQVSLDSDEYKNAPDGTNFTFTVDKVIKSGWTYDPTINEETSGTIIVGDGFGISPVGAGTGTAETSDQGFYQTWIAPAVKYISRLLGGGGE